MAVMQWIEAFFNLNWLDASAVICSVMAVGAGMVFLWRRWTGAAGPSDGYADSAETNSAFGRTRAA